MGSNTMGSDPMVKKFFSHYAPRPLQQPQMPDMKQVNNHIRHFFHLSYLPSAGNPSTQPPIRRLALPLIRSITHPNNSPIVPANISIAIIPPTTPHNSNSLFPTTNRQFLRSHRTHHCTTQDMASFSTKNATPAQKAHSPKRSTRRKRYF